MTIQYNTIQYNTIQYNTIQYNTIQCNPMLQRNITYEKKGILKLSHTQLWSNINTIQYSFIFRG